MWDGDFSAPAEKALYPVNYSFCFVKTGKMYYTVIGQIITVWLPDTVEKSGRWSRICAMIQERGIKIDTAAIKIRFDDRGLRFHE